MAAAQVVGYLGYTGGHGNAPAMAALDPTPTTWAVQQVLGYLGYSGCDADVVVTAALDP